MMMVVVADGINLDACADLVNVNEIVINIVACVDKKDDRIPHTHEPPTTAVNYTIIYKKLTSNGHTHTHNSLSSGIAQQMRI